MKLRLYALLLTLIIPILIMLITIVCSVTIIFLGLVKLIFPYLPFWHRISACADKVMWLWCQLFAAVIQFSPRLDWDIEGIEKLDKKRWYLLISNHQSWADIIVICILFRNLIPVNKYFIKQQMFWIPFIGLAAWALDMPFMKRYSKDFLLKHPNLRGRDIESTRRSCEKFRLRPTTVVNFVEGTRFTEEKRIKQNSTFHHLLLPKAAGIAFTLNTLGQQFDRILNVTLLYPDNRKSPFLDLIFGRMKRVVVRVETLPIKDEIRGDYINDPVFKHRFQSWLNALWLRKDKQLKILNAQAELQRKMD